MLDVEALEGLARDASWELAEHEVRLPAILHPDTQRNPAPDHAQLTLSARATGPGASIRYQGTRLSLDDDTDAELALPRSLIYPGSVDASLQRAADEVNATEGPVQVAHDVREITPTSGLLALPTAREVADDAWRLAGFLATARTRAGPNAILYTPGIGRPDQVAIAAYGGVDVFDGMVPLLAAKKGTYLTVENPDGQQPPATPPCACPACLEAETEGWTDEHLASHNAHALRREIRTVRQAIREGRLRELVEQRAHAAPGHLATLRRLDTDHADVYDRYMPSVRERRMPILGRRSLDRPAVTRWLDRLETRYSAPESASTLVVLPCSATKPYANSPTHRRIRPSIQNNANGRSHVVTLTSPLGAVPEELELAYPAQAYDVPVTGDWNTREEELIERAFRAIWKNGDYDQAILHLSPDEAELAERGLPRAERTVEPGQRPTDDDALDRLAEAVTDSVRGLQAVARDDMFAQHMANRVDWQFGQGVHEVMCEDTWIRGKYPWLKLIDADDDQLLMLKPERGALTLTSEGGQRLFEATDDFRIEIDDFHPKGSVFAPGVIDASDKIRPEDEIVCAHDGELRAVGRANVPGEIMAEMEAGSCAEVRHRA